MELTSPHLHFHGGRVDRNSSPVGSPAPGPPPAGPPLPPPSCGLKPWAAKPPGFVAPKAYCDRKKSSIPVWDCRGRDERIRRLAGARPDLLMLGHTT